MPNEPTNTPDDKGGTDTDDPPKSEPKTLTQEQINQIVEERLGRERKKQEEERAAERQKLEDEKKSEAQKLLDRIAAAEKRADEAESSVKKSDLEALRLRVANAKGLSETQASRLRGDTKEDLEADADDLLESFGGKKDEEEEPKDKGPFSRPKERLRPGASNEGDDAPDYDKIAERIASKTTI